MKNDVVIAIHVGAGEDSAYIKENLQAYQMGLKMAIESGQQILNDGGTAMDAVCAAVKLLEDNHLFNAGKGAALNHDGIVEMDAAVMNGRDLKAGAVTMVRGIPNPVGLAREVMDKTSHVLLAGYGAEAFARQIGVRFENISYFITPHQIDELENAKHESDEQLLHKRMKGTVGAVALDRYGNVAAATSTGGTCNSLPGRVGDSCLIGAGCYANNHTCAASGTGDGEVLIRNVTSHSVSMLMELGKYSLQEACNFAVHQRNTLSGDVGLIAVNKNGEIGIAFNSERMHRAWARNDDTPKVMIYQRDSPE